MFVNILYRVRAPDPGMAVVRAERHMELLQPDSYTSLLVICFERGVRAVLIDSSDWRKRLRQAIALRDQLTDAAVIAERARMSRFAWHFPALGGSAAQRKIYNTLREEYRGYVDNTERERTFFAATAGLVRELLDDDHWEQLFPDGRYSLAEYLADRDRDIAALQRHTTEESFPFTTSGPDLSQSKAFDLGGEGPVHHIVIDVHL